GASRTGPRFATKSVIRARRAAFRLLRPAASRAIGAPATPDRSRFPMHRFLILAAGLLGAGGVALLASAAHAGGDNLQTAAAFMLAHAPVLLAVGIAGRQAGGRILAPAALVVLAGVALFAGDLTLR